MPVTALRENDQRLRKPAFVSRLELRARRRRFALFLRLASTIVSPNRPMRILDVGGTREYWSHFDRSALGHVEIVLFNLSTQQSLLPTFTAVVGDGRDLSRYLDNQFDVVYSNSVLSLVGTFADQVRMAKEVRRVGKSYFVQTPNRFFVLDWRTLVPFFHLFPLAFQAWCFQRFRVGTHPLVAIPEEALQHAKRVRDLTATELRALFPEASIVRERIFGLTKSFVVHSGFKC